MQDLSQMPLYNQQSEGPRLSQDLLSSSTPDNKSDDILQQEREILKQRLEHLEQCTERQVQIQPADQLKSQVSLNYPQTTNVRDFPVVNDKTISYEVMLNAIGRRFHQCLHEESKARPNLGAKLSDADLVHQVCRKERLTFYNFLMENTVNGLTVTEEQIKS